MSGVVVCLYDETGYMGAPWAAAGYTVLCFDLVHQAITRQGNIYFLPWDADGADAACQVVSKVHEPVVLLAAFPPCTDLSVAGAAFFRTKRLQYPDFQAVAAKRASSVQALGQHFGCPWFVENPVGVLPSFWRPADCSFHPCEYGGYLEGMERFHPAFDGYIPAGDMYAKKTLLWTGNGFTLPPKRPVKPERFWSGNGYVSRQFMTCGGKSALTKTIRSATPRGFAKAVFLHMNQVQ